MPIFDIKGVDLTPTFLLAPAQLLFFYLSNCTRHRRATVKSLKLCFSVVDLNRIIISTRNFSYSNGYLTPTSISMSQRNPILGYHG